MKVLYLTKYSRNGASSRLRSYQYFPFLETNGISVAVRPFFDEEYLIDLYSGNRIAKRKLLIYYLNRFFVIFSVFKYDKIVIEKELFPYFFSWFERILYSLNIRYIVDYDDAIFHNYDLSNSKLMRFLLGNKINNVMKYSGCVVAGNSYLAERAKQAGAKNIIMVPTVIDVDAYKVTKKEVKDKVIVGWIGSPSTFKYVKNYTAVFSEILQNENVELHIVGTTDNLGLGTNVHYLKWTEETEVDLIANFDIGIMPLENTPWELGKCAYKLIQYMGCGLPVVASAVGMNKEVVDEKTGFLVQSETEWTTKLNELINNKELREQLGKMGRKKVESQFSLQKSSAIILHVLSNE
jgi:glycosyltransferase involved in cell wall biosynthesis